MSGSSERNELGRVVLCPVGTRGDVDPMLALARGLRGAGVTPVMCTSVSFEREVRRHEIAFFGIAQHDQAFNVAQARALSSPPREALTVLRRCFADAVDAQFDALLSGAMEGAALLLGGSGLHFAGPSVAEAHQVPYRFAALSPPVMRSSELPPPVFDWPARLAPTWVRIAWRAFGATFDFLLRGPINRRRARIGLPPLRGDIVSHLQADAPILAVDPELCPTPRGYPSSTLHTHAWRLQSRPSALPERVSAFLAAGPPPVYVGFGSNQYSESNPSTINRVVVSAVRRAGRRLIFARPSEALAADLAGDDVLVVDAVDHVTLFPSVALVVHHGGAGVSQTAARAGVPQFACAHMTDLFYWGNRLAQLGLGPEPLPLKRLTEDGLRQRIVTALSDAQMTARARALATRLNSAPNGVDEAVAALLPSLRSGCRR